jgi:hypothetical protein
MAESSPAKPPERREGAARYAVAAVIVLVVVLFALFNRERVAVDWILFERDSRLIYVIVAWPCWAPWRTGCCSVAGAAPGSSRDGEHRPAGPAVTGRVRPDGRGADRRRYGKQKARNLGTDAPASAPLHQWTPDTSAASSMTIWTSCFPP